jgi:hypothetical protein
MPSSPRAVAALACFALLSTAAPAAAQSGEPAARARSLQAQGLRLLEQQKSAEALAKFEAAYDLVPSPKILYNMGRAQEGLGRDLEAFTSFERFLEGATDVPPAARADAERRRDALRARLAAVEVTGPAGATVVVDGRAVGELPLGAPVLVAPGAHAVLIQRAGTILHEQRVTAASGGTVVVKLAVVESPPPRPAADAPAPAPRPEVVVAAPPPEGAPRSWQRPAAWTSAGLAVAALGVGTAFQLRASSKFEAFNDVREAPLTANGRCNDRAPQGGGGPCEGLLDAGRSARRMALFGFVSGGLLAAASAGLFYLSGAGAEEAPRTAWGCAPLGGPGVGCGLRF